MSSNSRGSRQALTTGLLTALLAFVIAVTAAPSQARPAQEPFRTSYQPAAPSSSIGGDQPPYNTAGVARAGFDHVASPEEKYFASFGTPKPVASGHTSGSSDDTPWVLIGLAGGITVLLVGVGASQLGRRHVRHGRIEIPA